MDVEQFPGKEKAPIARGLLLTVGVHPPVLQDFYRPPGLLPWLLLVPGPTLPELELSPPAFPVPAPVVPLFMPVPVVVPDFIFESEVTPGPTLPELEAPGAGWVCAEAMAVAPSRPAATRAVIAKRMRTTPCLNDAKSKRDPFKCVPFKVQRWPGYQSDAGELVAPVQLQLPKTS